MSVSLDDTEFSWCLATDDLLDFFSVPSQFAKAHGRGPNGCCKTSFIFISLVFAITTVRLKSWLSTFIIVTLFADDTTLVLTLQPLTYLSRLLGKLSKMHFLWLICLQWNAENLLLPLSVHLTCRHIGYIREFKTPDETFTTGPKESAAVFNKVNNGFNMSIVECKSCFAEVWVLETLAFIWDYLMKLFKT